MAAKSLISLLLALAVLGTAFAAPQEREGEDESATPPRQEQGGPLVVLGRYLTGLFPGSPAAHLLLGRAYALEGLQREAVDEMIAALELDPSYLEARLRLAELYSNRGRQQAAREQFAAALRLDPNSYSAHLGLGTIAARAGRAEEAEEHLTRALEIRPDDYAALLQLGRLYALRAGESGRAIATLRRAYMLRPDEPELNYELGLLYYQTSQYAEATYFLRKAVRLDPDRTAYRLALGKSLYHQSEYDDALGHLRRAARDDPRNPEPHYYMGGVLLAQEHYPRASAALRRAHRLRPGYRDVLFFLGKADFHQGLHRRAVSNLLRYRIGHLVEGRGDPAALAESMELILESERVLGIERRPNQLPGSIDPAQMAAVPGGRFLYGGYRPPDGDEGFSAEVLIDPFAIDRTEVSNADYRVFLLATGWRVPRADQVPGAGVTTRFNWVEAEKAFPAGTADLPVVNVSWEDAVAYAAWVGKRLPTEAEWERAARGGRHGSRYPWGDRAPDERQANYRSEGPRAMDAAEPNGYGLLHAVGNAAEWCSDWFEPDLSIAAGLRENPQGPPTGALRSYRGGHWRSDADGLQVARRGGLSPGARSPYVGFRCAADISPSGDDER